MPGLDSASATYYVGKPPASTRLMCEVASEEHLAHGAAGRVQCVHVINVKCTKQGLLCQGPRRAVTLSSCLLEYLSESASTLNTGCDHVLLSLCHQKWILAVY